MKKTLTMSMTVGNIEILANPDIPYIIHDKLVKGIASEIVDVRMKEIPYNDGYAKKYEINLVVADPSDYWKDVEDKARELHFRLNPVRFDEKDIIY